MKLIIFNDSEENIQVSLTPSKRCICIADGNTDVFILTEGLDKLIEALQQIKGELS